MSTHFSPSATSKKSLAYPSPTQARTTHSPPTRYPVDKSHFLGSRVNFQFLGSYPRENCALHPLLGRAIRRSGFGLRDFCHWPAIRHNSTSRRPLRNNGTRFRFHPPRESIVLRPALLFISVAALTTALAAEPGRDQIGRAHV